MAADCFDDDTAGVGMIRHTLEDKHTICGYASEGETGRYYHGSTYTHVYTYHTKYIYTIHI